MVVVVVAAVVVVVVVVAAAVVVVAQPEGQLSLAQTTRGCTRPEG